MRKQKNRRNCMIRLLKNASLISLSAVLLTVWPMKTNSEVILEDETVEAAYDLSPLGEGSWENDDPSSGEFLFDMDDVVEDNDMVLDNAGEGYSILSDDGDTVDGLSDFEVAYDGPGEEEQGEGSDSEGTTLQEGMAEETGNSIRSGECGMQEGTVFWNLDEEGVLHIYGEGSMKDWETPEEVPWYAIAGQVRELEIGEGITDIGSYAFSSCVLKSARFG